MTELNNLEKLTNQIYQEGIEKAESQSKELLQEAERKKEAMLSEARQEAEKIIAEAKKESERIKRSTENEVRLKGEQLISDFKVKLLNLLSDKVLAEKTTASLEDTGFLQEIIKETVSHWKSSKELELVLPEKLEKSLSKGFLSGIKKELPNLEIVFSNRIKGGFRINKKDEGYQVSFSDEDFVLLFRSYLTDQTEKILFCSWWHIIL
jgi:V/A-type H+-transporting ATPase subunit E